MKKIFWTLIGILIFLIICVFVDYCNAETTIHPDLTLYTMTTDVLLTIEWDDTNSLVDFFEFYLWNYGEEKKYLIGKTQQIRATMFLPRTGLWVFYIKTCDKVETDDTRECSDWVHSNLLDSQGVPYGKVEDSNNPGTYIKGKWMIYGHVAPPTSGGIE